jgi:hypothetical protein
MKATEASSNAQVYRFDWQQWVAANLPNEDSVAGQERSALLKQLVADLAVWSNQYSFPKTRIKACAYTGVYTVAEPTNQYLQGLLASEYTLWLFVFDDYIDRLDYSQYTDNQANLKQAYLEVALHPIVQTLVTCGLGQGQLQSYDLESSFRATPIEQSSSAAEGLGLALAAALKDIYANLQTALRATDQEDIAFALSNFVTETTAVVSAMRQELLQSFYYLQRQVLPTLEEYLNNSKYSICLRAAGTVALAFEESGLASIWQAWQLAMTSGARSLRLTNDIANVFKEFEERKVNAVTIILAAQGFSTMGPYHQDSFEVLQARTLLTLERQKELDLFVTQSLAKSPSGIFAYYVYSSMAFTIAMYVKGDYELL